MGREGQRYEFLRFLINGVAATIVHFGVLAFLLEGLRLPSAGFANAIAALVGIGVSYVGNRFFVFRARTQPVLGTLWRFGLLYLTMAAFHAGALFVWTDLFGHDYRAGFVIATGVQVLISYFGNRLLVFSR